PGRASRSRRRPRSARARGSARPATACRRGAARPPEPAPARRAPRRCTRGTPRRTTSARRRQVVRKLGEELVAVLGDEHEILVADAAAAHVIEPGLDRDHVARDERLAPREAEAGRLVGLEADAVPERGLEAVLLPVRGPLRREAGRLEELARRVEELPAGDARTHRRLRLLERLAHEPVLVGDQLSVLRHRVARDEGARHVRPAAALLVAWP